MQRQLPQSGFVGLHETGLRLRFGSNLEATKEFSEAINAVRLRAAQRCSTEMLTAIAGLTLETAMKRLALAIVFLLFPGAALGVITFDQLDDDVFVVSHRVKVIGSRGKAMTMVHEKAASLCIAAGFTHLEILSQESEAAQEDKSANASLRVQFFHEDGEGRIACEGKADPQYVAAAREKLARLGYQQPDASVDPSKPHVTTESSGLGSCTLEQIAAMARTGLSDEQIRSACSKKPGP